MKELKMLPNKILEIKKWIAEIKTQVRHIRTKKAIENEAQSQKDGNYRCKGMSYTW